MIICNLFAYQQINYPSGLVTTSHLWGNDIILRHRLYFPISIHLDSLQQPVNSYFSLQCFYFFPRNFLNVVICAISFGLLTTDLILSVIYSNQLLYISGIPCHVSFLFYHIAVIVTAKIGDSYFSIKSKQKGQPHWTTQHLKVKEKDISLTKNYCITVSIKKISSVHRFILKIMISWPRPFLTKPIQKSLNF